MLHPPVACQALAALMCIPALMEACYIKKMGRHP